MCGPGISFVIHIFQFELVELDLDFFVCDFVSLYKLVLDDCDRMEATVRSRTYAVPQHLKDRSPSAPDSGGLAVALAGADISVIFVHGRREKGRRYG